MYQCSVCRFEVQLDDVLEGTITPAGHCVCIRCYHRETLTARSVPPWLRRQVEAAAGAGAGG